MMEFIDQYEEFVIDKIVIFHNLEWITELSMQLTLILFYLLNYQSVLFLIINEDRLKVGLKYDVNLYLK